jgi:hypothetical protein
MLLCQAEIEMVLLEPEANAGGSLIFKLVNEENVCLVFAMVYQHFTQRFDFAKLPPARSYNWRLLLSGQALSG